MGFSVFGTPLDDSVNGGYVDIYSGDVSVVLVLKPWSARGASYHPLIWATIIHTFFSLIHPVDEFSFKEMRM